MLCTTINLVVEAYNINSESNSYHCFAYGTDLTPANSDIADGGVQEITGSIDVPEAFVGSEGTYNLQQTGYDFFVLPNGQRSTALLPGTVTYVTQQTEVEIITTQTIEFNPVVEANIIPLQFSGGEFDQGAPTATLNVTLDVGDGSEKREAVTTKKQLIIKRTMKKQHEQQTTSVKA